MFGAKYLRPLILISIWCATFFGCQRKPYPDILVPEPGELTDFILSYGGGGDEEVFSVIATSDSGFLMIGNTTTLSNGDKDMYLAKTDLNGNLLWSKPIGGAAIDGGFDVIETGDHHYLAVGFSKSYNFTNGYEVFLVKTDPDGNIVWQKTFGNPNNDCAKSIIKENSSDNFILAGGSDGVNIQLGSSVYVAKISPDGDSIWTKQYYGNTIEIGNSVCTDVNNNIMILSGCENPVSGSHLFLNYLNHDGDTIWTLVSGSGLNDKAGQIIPVPGNAFISVNTTSSVTDPSGDIFISKISDTGTVLWEKIIDSGFEDAGTSILLSSDNSLVIAGAESENPGLRKAFIMKADLSGNIIWKKTFGDSASYSAQDIIETATSFLLSGTKELQSGNKDAFLIKVKK